MSCNIDQIKKKKSKIRENVKKIKVGAQEQCGLPWKRDEVFQQLPGGEGFW